MKAAHLEDDAGATAGRRFAIYRAADARDYSEPDVQRIVDMTEEVAAGLSQYAQYPEAQTVKLLYATPGFSLTYVWFKSGFPLPVHSHANDCLYYIVGGSLKIGNETLGVGDGFFVAADVAYTYSVGDDGVEVIEFRATDQLNIRFRSNGKAAWEVAASVLAAHKTVWSTEVPPSRNR